MIFLSLYKVCLRVNGQGLETHVGLLLAASLAKLQRLNYDLRHTAASHQSQYYYSLHGSIWIINTKKSLAHFISIILRLKAEFMRLCISHSRLDRDLTASPARLSSFSLVWTIAFMN